MVNPMSPGDDVSKAAHANRHTGAVGSPTHPNRTLRPPPPTVQTSPPFEDIDRLRFAEAVESAFRVSNRQQFFIWTQASVQALIPHEILICGVEDGSREGLALHKFSSSRYFGQDQFDQVADAVMFLVPKLVSLSEGTNGSVVFCPAEQGAPTDGDLHALVQSSELKNLAAQLVVGVRGTVEAFYGFSRLSCKLDSRLRFAMQLLTPHLHLTLLRVLANERLALAVSAQRGSRMVTPRQEEILNLMKTGKTNAEIAELLTCSPWTVKNHIQAILRKLDTTSRAHAVSRAISLGILRAE